MNTYNEFFFQSIELIEQFRKTRSEKQVYKILVEENDIPKELAHEMLKEYYIGEETKQRN